MNDKWAIAAAIVAFVMLLAAGVWWELYKYHDCLNVGHSHLYCMGRLLVG